MTTSARDQDKTAAIAELRAEVQRTKEAAHVAIDALDPALGIALLRTLRSLQWRARNLGIDLAH